MEYEPDTPRETSSPGRRVWCVRVGRSKPISEHLHCPYCRGDELQVGTGVHQTFCDFRPGIDPVSFGFPEDRGRHLRE